MTIIVLTNTNDVHADYVLPKLEARRGQDVVRLNTDRIIDNWKVQIAHSPSSGSTAFAGEILLIDSGRRIVLEEVTTVWYRKPQPIVTVPQREIGSLKEFRQRETDLTYKAMLGLLEGCFWVSHMDAIRVAGNKMRNLEVAADLGLKVPDTLVTNAYDAFFAFGETHDWRIIAKPFALMSFELDQQGKSSWDTFATPVKRADAERLAPNIETVPVILQKYIEKNIELRATVVGDEVFCTSIDSQKNPRARYDWRSVDVAELDHETYTLPHDIAAQLRAFNRHFGLNFSTFDLIVDRQGDHVFLECNPNGQWLWLELCTGQPISEALVGLLADQGSWPSMRGAFDQEHEHGNISL